MNTKYKKHLFKPCFLLSLLILLCSNGYSQTTMISEMEELKWEKVMPGIWKASFGKMGLNPMDYANEPKVGAIKALGDAPFPFAQDASRSLLTPNRASVRLPLRETE